jgi:hypothetical protein
LQILRIDKISAGRNAGGTVQIGGHIIKLDLHIGTEKTGTTSFQHWLKDNRARLEARGAIRPAWEARFLPDINHRMLAVYAQGFAPEDDGQQHLGLATQADYDTLCTAFEAAFTQEVARRGAGRWVMSAEHLHSRLSDGAQVARLATLLRRFFGDITIHIHLRPQVDMALSRASTGIRRGGRIDRRFFDRVTPDNPVYNYAELVRRWAAVFGAANICLIPYKRQPSMRAYFLALWGMKADDFAPEHKMNRALDWRSMAMQNALAPHLGVMPNALGLNDLWEALPFEAPLRIPQDMAERIDARMRPSNQALVQAWPALTLDDLTPDPGDYTAPETLSRLTPQCDFAPQAAAAIVELQCRLILEQTRTEVLRAEKAHAAGRTDRAIARLEQAARQIRVIKPLWGERHDYRAICRFIDTLFSRYRP